MHPSGPSLEPLEARLLLSETLLWDGGGDGLSWHDPLNWANDVLPGADHDVRIEGAGGAITYSADAGASAVHSLMSDRPLSLTGGSLAVADTVQVNSTFTLNGGTLADAYVLAGSGGQGVDVTSNADSRLSAVTLAANLRMTDSGDRVTVLDGLTLDGSTVSLGSTGVLVVGNTMTLGGTGQVSATSATAGVTVMDDAVLTIGPGVTVTLSASALKTGGTGEGAVVNQGTVQGYGFTVNTAFTNEGLLDFYYASTGSSNTINGSFENTADGTVRVRALTYYAYGTNYYTTTLTVASGFENAGLIELTDTKHSTGTQGTTVTLAVTSGTLVNASTGVIVVTDDAGDGLNTTTARSINASIDNAGLIRAERELRLQRSGVTYTNSGTIELVDGGKALQIGNFGTFTNTGLIDAGAAGLELYTFTTFENSGTVRVTGGALNTRSFTDFTTSGLVEVTGGAWDVSSYTRVTNTGEIRLGEGLQLYLHAGRLIHAGPVLEVGSLRVDSGTVEVAVPWEVEDVWALYASTLTGTGPVTNRGTVLGYNVTIAVPLVNAGLLDFHYGSGGSSNTINGSFENTVDGTVRVRALTYYAYGTNYYTTTLTVASGFENAGLIELTDTKYSTGTQGTTVTLAVTSGTLVNAVTGVIVVTDDSSDGLNTTTARSINASIDNAGLIRAERELRLQRSGVTYTNSGTIELVDGGKALQIGNFGTFTNTGLIDAGAAGLELYTFTTFENSGTVRVTGGALNTRSFTDFTNSGLVEVTGGAWDVSSYTRVTNTGEIRLGEGLQLYLHAGRLIHAGPVLEVGSLRVDSGTVEVAVPWEVEDVWALYASTLTGTGPVTNRGTVLGYNVTIAVPLVNAGLLDFHYGSGGSSNTINGSFENTVDGTVRVRALTYYAYGYAYSSTSLTVASGFENAGLIELTDTKHADQSYGTTVTLVVTSGTLVNASTGVIVVTDDSSDGLNTTTARSINASLDNQGRITAERELRLLRSGMTYTNSGTIELVGGGKALQIGNFGTFTNTGLIDAGAAGLELYGFTTFDNSGTVRVTGGALNTRSFTDFTNSGVVEATGGAWDVSSYTRVTNTGEIRLGADRQLYLHAGRLIHAGTALEVGSLRVDSGTVEVNVPWEVEVPWYLYSSTLAGTGPVTNRSTVLGYDITITVPLVNAGLLDFHYVSNGSSNYINGSFENTADGTVRVRALTYYTYGYAYHQTTLTVASGFENAGRIELTDNKHADQGYGTTVTLAVTSGTLVNESTGVIVVTDDASDGLNTTTARSINASIDNAGLIRAERELRLLRSGMTYTNSGTIELVGGGKALQIGNFGTFTNTGLIDAGAAGLELYGFTTFDNSGTVRVTGGALNTRSFTDFTNSGLVEVTGGAWDVSSYTRVTNTGEIRLGEGLQLYLHAGRLIHAGPVLEVGSLRVDSGTVEVNVPLEVEAPWSLYSSTLAGTGPVTNRSTVGGYNVTITVPLVNAGLLDFHYVSSGSSNYINGSFENTADGTVRVRALTYYTYGYAYHQTTLTVASGFENAGLIELTDNKHADQGYGTTVTLVVTSGTLVNASTGVIVVTDDSSDGLNTTTARYINASIDNRGTLRAERSLTTNKANAAFTNTGTLEVAAGATYTHTSSGATVTNLAAGSLTGGTYDIAGVWKFNSAAITVNAADLTLDGAAARILNQSGANALAALVANAAGASFAITNGYALATPGGFANAGSLTIGNGATFTAGGAYVQTAGATVLAGGVLSAAGGVDIQAGLIAGTGTVGANLTAAGEVRPGGSAGTLNVVGDYTETPDTVLYLEIGGLTPGDGHDQLNATGLATFAGTLVVSLIDPFEPALGDAFTVLTYDARAGDFVDVQGLELAGFKAFTPVVHDQDLVLLVAVAPAGPGPTLVADPQAGHVAADIDAIHLYLSEPVVGDDARNPAAYVLLDLGPDRLPGTADDAEIPVTPAYADGEVVITLALPGVLDDGAYRLTVRSWHEGAAEPGIHDAEGYGLDGNANGLPGDDFVMNLVVDRLAPTVTDVAVTPGAITVTFFDAGGLDAATVTDAAHYALVASGGDGAFGQGNDVAIDLPAALAGITYDPATGAAVLTFATPLPDEVYQLTVRGADGVADLAGNPLGGGADAVAARDLLTGPAVVAARLRAADDTGASSADGVTSVTAPVFEVTVNKAGLIEVDYDGGGPDAALLVAAAGTYAFAGPVLAEGDHAVSVAFTPAVGAPVADALDVRIDTVAPLVATDAGGDPLIALTKTTVTVVFDDAGGMDPAAVTSAANYRLVASGGDGTFGEANDIDRTGRITSVSYDPATGTATLHLSPGLDDEHYQVTVNPSGGLRDLAGNLLEAGGPVVVERVLDTGPATVTVDLDAGSDSGASASDNLTNVTAPTFRVAVNRPGLVEVDFDGDGTADASQAVAESGVVVFTSPVALAEGVRRISATLTPLVGDPAEGHLDITIDTTGPAVTAMAPDGTVHAAVSSVTLTFSEAIHLATATAADVLLTDPDAAPVGVYGFSSLGGTDYRVTFPVQQRLGTYDVAVGPGIADLAGNLMNQDGLAPNGEVPADVFAAQFTVSLPDLEVLSVTPGVASAAFGQTIQVQWVVRNAGDWPADATWSDRVWFSADPVLGGDTALATVSAATYSPLGAGGQYVAAASVRVPITESLPNGTYYLIVQTDSGGAVGEADEGHNTFAAAIDLVRLSGPAVVAMRPADGDGVITYADVSFDGEIDAASFTAADVTLVGPAGPVAVTGVQYLANHTYRITFAKPAAAGTHTLTVGPNITDALGNRMDQNGDGTNGDPFTGTFDVRLPDLVVEAVTVTPSSAAFGQTVVVEWRVRNAGQVTATGTWYDRIALSDDAVPGGDIVLATIARPGTGALAAGGTYTASATVLIPQGTGLADGTHAIIVTADGTAVLAEADEAANAAAADIALTTTPGPVITGMAAGPAGGVASYVDVTFDRPIAPATFQVADVALTGPGGAPVAVTGITPQGGTTYRLSFQPPALAGTYRLAVGPDIADAAGNAMNQNGATPNGEPGDAFVGFFDVLLPDLAADAVGTDRAAAWFGETIPVTWTVDNAGGAVAAGTWLDRVYLSRDTVLDAADVAVLAAWTTYAPLEAGATAAASGLAKIPLDPALPEGTWYLILRVNAGGQLVEAGVAPNVAVSDPLTLSTRSGAAVTEMAAVYDAAGAVTAVVVALDVPVLASTFQAADVTLTGPAGAVPVTGVARQADGTFRIAFARQTAAGTYDLTVGPAVADLLGNPMDQDGDGTNGDGFAGQFAITLPDLYVDSIVPDVAAQVFGGAVGLEYTVHNADATAAAGGTWTERVWLSADATLDSGDRLLAERISGPVAPGGAQPVALAVDLPLDHALAEGTYYLLVQTDAAGGLLEADEANNVAAGPALALTFPVLPDLTVEGVAQVVGAEASGVAVFGREMELAWTVVNAGTAPATGTWTETVYVSDDPVLGNDILAAAFSYSAPLGAGESVARSETFTMPLISWMGDAYFIVVADAGNRLFEADEANNAGVAAEPTVVVLDLAGQLEADQVAEDGDPVRGILVRNGPVTDDLVVYVTVVGPDDLVDATEVSAPLTVIIPAGQRRAEFWLTPIADGVVDGAQLMSVLFEADALDGDPYNVDADGILLGAPIGGVASLVVLDADAYALAIDLPVTLLVEGGAATATVRCDPAVGIDVTVDLYADAGQLLVPASVVIPAGADSVDFEIRAVDDAVMEAYRDVVITADSTMHGRATATLGVVDNDLVQLTVTIDAASIVEGTFGAATWGTVTRSGPTDAALTVLLESDDTTAAKVLPTLRFAAGEASARFAIAAADDALADGTQTAVITATPTDPQTGEALPAGAGAASVDVLDNDGPTLTVTLAGPLVSETGTLAATVYRNTADTSTPLVVTLGSSDTGEATVPATVEIPVGAASVGFTITGVADGIADGKQAATITASADGFNAGAAAVYVIDEDLPDLRVTDLVCQATAFTDGLFEASWTVRNDGVSDAGPAWIETVYVSRDDRPDPSEMVDLAQFSGTLAPGQFYQRTLMLNAPDALGSYYVIVVVDAGGVIGEAIEENNTAVSPATLEVLPAYTATVAAEVHQALANEPVLLYGTATDAATGQPAAYSLVSVQVLHAGSRRVLGALTDAFGRYTVTFRPLWNEAGLYEVAAGHPAGGAGAAQDTFVLLGAAADPSYLAHSIVIGEAAAGQVLIRNLSGIALANLQAAVVGAPANLDVQVALAAGTLDGSGAVALDYSITPLDLSAAESYWDLRVTTDEGVTVVIPVAVQVRGLYGKLSGPAQLKGGMIRGEQKLVEFTVTNTGTVATGPVTLALPEASWLSAASGTALASLAPGASAKVTLLLSPQADLPLGDYTGTLILSAQGTWLEIPFAVRCLTDAMGDVRFRVVDEYVYFADATGLEGARVGAYDPYTGESLASGTTDADGYVTLTGLPEMIVNYAVWSDKHDTVRDTVRVVAGQTVETEVFLSTQFVEFRWVVEEIEVEDRYTVTLQTVYETNVPAPVVTITPGIIDLAQLTDEVTQIDMVITNHGLVAAEDVTLRYGTHPLWEITPLVSDLGRLNAQSSITVPLFIRRLTPSGSQAEAILAAAENAQAAFYTYAGTENAQCQVAGGARYWYSCGAYDVGKTTPQTFTGAAEDCQPTTPPPGGGGGPGVPPLPPPAPRPPVPGEPGAPTWPEEPRRGGGGGISQPGERTPVISGGGYGGGGFWSGGDTDCKCDPNTFNSQSYSASFGYSGGLGWFTDYMVMGASLSLQIASGGQPFYFTQPEWKLMGGAKVTTCCTKKDPESDQAYAGIKKDISGSASVEGSLNWGKQLEINQLTTIPMLNGSTVGQLQIYGEAAIKFKLVLAGSIDYKTGCHLQDPSCSINASFNVTLGPTISLSGSFTSGSAKYSVSGMARVVGGASGGLRYTMGAENPLRLWAKFDGIWAELQLKFKQENRTEQYNWRYQLVDGTDPWYWEGSIPFLTSESLPASVDPAFADSLAGLADMTADDLAAWAGYASPAAMLAAYSGGVVPAGAWGPVGSVDELVEQLDRATRLRAAAEAGRVAYASEAVALPAADPDQGTCAQVRIQIDQEAVTTRKVFAATMQITDNAQVPLEDVWVDIDIYDAYGHVANDKFTILPPELTNLVETSDGLPPEGYDPGLYGPYFATPRWSLAAGQTGTARWTIIPKAEAALDGPAVYYIGGTYTYALGEFVSNGVMTPAQITVQPNAQIDLLYFWQRDVYSDDPFTEDVEPAVPFSLALMATNHGLGTAEDFQIESAQPEIIENAKGLLVDFNIIAAEVGGQAMDPSLTLNLGDIGPGETVVGRWLLTAPLQGHFISYDATFVHQDPFGDLLPSLLDEVTIHELIHVVRAGGVFDDGLYDFLANDVEDETYEPVPDTLYLSDGTAVPVGVGEFLGATVAPAGAGLTADVAVAMPDGWGYVKMPDPAGGAYRLVRVVRLDAAGNELGEVAVDWNAWQTDRTYKEERQRPVAEDVVHLLDHDGADAYRLTYVPRDDQAPYLVDLEKVQGPIETPVEALAVVFSEPVRLATFDHADVRVLRDGVEQDTSGLAVVSAGAAAYRIEGLAAVTGPNGVYRVEVHAAGVEDLWGNAGVGSLVTTWIKAEDAPAVQELVDVPTGTVSATNDSVYVKFLEAIDPATFGLEDLSLTLNGGPNLITPAAPPEGFAPADAGDPGVTISAVAADTYRISGLAGLAGADGEYVLTVDPTGVATPTGVAGIGQASAAWQVDGTGPAVVEVLGVPAALTNASVANLEIVFSDAVNPATFTLADLALRRSGGPNLLGSGATLAQVDATTWRLSGLAAVTAATGVYELTVYETGVGDALGNAGPGTFVARWTVDATPPAAPLSVMISPDSGAAADDLRTRYYTLEVSGVLAETGLALRLIDDTLHADFGPVAVQGTTFSTDITLSVPGVHDLRLVMTDAAGNTASSTFHVFVDPFGPHIAAVEGVPAGMTTDAVEYLDVVFSEAIDPATFDWTDLSLTRGGVELAGPAVTVQPLGPATFRIGGLAALTADLGTYMLEVRAAGVADVAGNPGTGVVAAGWEVVADLDPPAVTGVTVQDGQTQRWDVSRFEVAFSEAMRLQALIDAGTIVTAVHLTNLGVVADQDADTPVLLAAAQFVYDGGVLSWDAQRCVPCGGGLERLPDGYYELRLDAALVADLAGNALDGDADGLAGGDFVAHFHVLAADVTGDGVVDGADAALVDEALGLRDGWPGWNAELDLNGDGLISSRDRLIVYGAAGSAIVPPDDVAPTVVEVTVQGGLTERSYVDTFAITFSEPTNLADLIADGSVVAAVTLTNLGLNADADPDVAVPLAAADFQYDPDTFTLTWTLPAAGGAGASLADGCYAIRLDGSLITDRAGNHLAAAAEMFVAPGFGPVDLVRAGGAAIQAAAYAAPAFVDWNADGLPDLLVGEKADTVGKVRLYLNVGAAGAPAFGGFTYLQADGADLTVPTDGCLGAAPLAVDYDADGRKDLLVGRADGTISLFLNAGTAAAPVLAAAGLVLVGEPGSKAALDVGSRAMPAAADWNNDGRWDLVVGALDGTVRVYLNQGIAGAPDFRAAAAVQDGSAGLQVPGGRSAPAVVDLDGDGRKDLVVGNTDGQVYLYRNVGTDAAPAFDGGVALESDGAAIALGTTRSRPFVAHYDADDELDLVVGGADGLVRLYLGQPAEPAGEDPGVVVAYFHVLEGDADGNAVVDESDVALVDAALGATPTTPDWNANADLDRNGQVTTEDRVIVHEALGHQVVPPAGPAESTSGDEGGAAAPGVSTTVQAEAGGDVADAATGAFGLGLVASGTTIRTWTASAAAALGSGDTDWFVIQAPVSGTLEMQVLSTAGVLPDLVLYEQPAGEPQGWIIEEAAGAGAAATTAVAGRSYYLKVSGASVAAAEYQVVISLAEFDEYLTLIGADTVLADSTLRGAGYSVAIIDTGIDYTHPDLAGRVILGPDFADGDDDPMDTVGHGTHVAGLVVSGNGYAPGLAPEAKVIALKIVSDGSTPASLGTIRSALQWVIDHRDVYHIVAVNLSFASGNVADDGAPADLDPLYRRLVDLGVFVAAASGNAYAFYGAEGISELAAGPWVASVGAVWDSDAGPASWRTGACDYSSDADRIASFTQRSADLDLLAPGANILNLSAGGGLKVMSGTSAATPLVVGTAVLVREAADRAGLALGPQAMLDLLRASGAAVYDGDDEDDNVANTGRLFSRLDTEAALALLDAEAAAAAGTMVPTVVHGEVLLVAPAVFHVAEGTALVLAGGVDAAGHTLTKDGSGTLELAGTTALGGLNVAEGAVRLTGGGAIVAGSVGVAAGATLDLGEGCLIVDYGPGGSPIAEIAAWVASGAGGAGTGAGITSGVAASDAAALTALGVLDNADPSVGGRTEFAGRAVDATSVLVRYTWRGDANLDGVVDANDYDVIDKTFLFALVAGNTGWWTGDFTCDGRVDANDYDAIDKAYLFQAAPLAAGAPAPLEQAPTATEPADEANLLVLAVASGTVVRPADAADDPAAATALPAAAAVTAEDETSAPARIEPETDAGARSDADLFAWEEEGGLDDSTAAAQDLDDDLADGLDLVALGVPLGV